MITYWSKDQTPNGNEQSGHLKSFDLINIMVLKKLGIMFLGNPAKEECSTFKATCGAFYSSAELRYTGNFWRNNTLGDTFQITKDEKSFSNYGEDLELIDSSFLYFGGFNQTSPTAHFVCVTMRAAVMWFLLELSNPARSAST